MSVYPIVFTQGTFTHRDNLKFPFEERGLQFGDGVYEVIRIYKGKYYLLKEHIDRLYRSLDEIKINLPYAKDDFTKMILNLIDRNNMDVDGRVYLQVTRGSAARNHLFPENVEPNVYAYIEPAERPVETIKNGVSTITRPDIRWSYCHIKSLNLLPNLMAKQEAKEQGSYEAILHEDGVVTECSSANAFLVKDGKIYTHPTTNDILYGCVRMAIERFAADLAIPIVHQAFTLEDIASADEMFLSSSTSEITPIVEVDGKLIRDGKPGAITQKLQTAYALDANIEALTYESSAVPTEAK
ncbi:D-amino-acid transaminase [Oceanobacillus sp. CAU 1775]